MLVGPTGCGKSQAYKTLIEALYLKDKIKGELYIIGKMVKFRPQSYS